ALDEEEIGGERGEPVAGAEHRREVERAPLEGGRHRRGERGAQPVDRAGRRARRVLAAGGAGQRLGVGGDELSAAVRLAAALHRLGGQGAQALAAGGREQGARGGGLADRGVGAGDEKAPHGATSARARSTEVTRRSISSSVMDRGGISTTTSPSGRRMTPWSRAAAQTRAPVASSGGSGRASSRSATSSTPTMRPRWRMSPTRGCEARFRARAARRRSALPGSDARTPSRSKRSRLAR